MQAMGYIKQMSLERCQRCPPMRGTRRTMMLTHNYADSLMHVLSLLSCASLCLVTGPAAYSNIG
jgi:hypothetical protein